MDRLSFIFGMITAFAECLAYECKKTAFSPPFYPDDYETVRPEAERIARENGVFLHYEENLDIPAEKRVNWFVMYKYPELLEEYRQLRNRGFNPALHFEKFFDLLSYGIIWGKGAGQIVPKIREKRQMESTVSRVIFKPGDWPVRE